MRGIDRVNSWKLFPRAEMIITRGHKFKVRRERLSGDVQGKVFTQMAWNALQVGWLRQIR